MTRAILSPSRSFIWINWPAWILDTIFAGMGGRAEDSIRPWLLPVEAIAASTNGKEPVATATLDGVVSDAVIAGVLTLDDKMLAELKVVKHAILLARGKAPIIDRKSVV